jgi:hypothetical protein
VYIHREVIFLENVLIGHIRSRSFAERQYLVRDWPLSLGEILKITRLPVRRTELGAEHSHEVTRPAN